MKQVISKEKTMRTKEEILKEASSGMSRTTGNGAELAIAEALLDIRDIHYEVDERLITLKSSVERIADRLARRNW